MMAYYAATVDDSFALPVLVDIKKAAEKEYHVGAHVAFVEDSRVGDPNQAICIVYDHTDSGRGELRKSLHQRRFKFFMLGSKCRNVAAGRR